MEIVGENRSILSSLVFLLFPVGIKKLGAGEEN